MKLPYLLKSTAGLAALLLGLAQSVQAQTAAVLWLKADAITGLNDGDAVTMWADSSSSGNDATTTAGDPTYETNELNGNPVIRFGEGGTGDQLTVSDHSSLDLDAYTIFTVPRFSILSTFEVLYNKGQWPSGPTSPVGGNYRMYADGATFSTQHLNMAVDNGLQSQITGVSAVDGGWAILSFYYDGSNLPNTTAMDVYLNGTLDSTGAKQIAAAGNDVTNDLDLYIGLEPTRLNNGFGMTSGGGDLAEFIICDGALSGQEILDVNAYLGQKYGITVAPGGDPGAGLALLTGLRLQLAVSYDGDTNELIFTWDSKDGSLYNLRSETDPATNSDPATWPIFDGHENLEATPPENTLVIPLPADPTRLFVIEEFPAPPVSLVSDDFENGQGDWTAGSDGLDGTAWELGAPSNFGPNSANSPTNCFGTNLAGKYDFDADVWLRSPPIDLTNAAGATLHYFQFFEIEPDFDSGTVSLLDASNDSVLAVLVPTVDGSSAGWEKVSMTLPAAALGNSVKIEFRLDSDDVENEAGWYIDDFDLTVP